MVCMTVWDFVIGVLFGIVVSCELFLPPLSRWLNLKRTNPRLFLRGSKFAADEYSGVAHG
jgi:hypothetical protein